MAYSDFNLKSVQEQFGLNFNEDTDLFKTVQEITVSPWLQDFLTEWKDAALAMNTEKARSEMIIAPILMETVRLSGHQVRLFSGITFDVDKDRGLNGTCDYLLARSPERFFPGKPVLVVVEAKKEDIPGGLGQCVAEMVAVQIYNEHEGNDLTSIYGAVTTGSVWRFLKLQNHTVFIDRSEYYLHQIGKILGILYLMVS